MPWKTNSDLPKQIKDVLPNEAQTIWRNIANNAMAQDGYTEAMAFATAWNGLKRAKWEKRGDEWVKMQKEEIEKQFIFDILKSDNEKRIAFGWSMISRNSSGEEVWDLQNDGIDPDDLEDLAYRYVKLYRDSGEMHNGSSGKAILIESVVTTLEKQKVWGVPENCMPVGWWTGFYVIDDNVWELVKSGVYKAFSIEGKAKREKQS